MCAQEDNTTTTATTPAQAACEQKCPKSGDKANRTKVIQTAQTLTLKIQQTKMCLLHTVRCQNESTDYRMGLQYESQYPCGQNNG